MTTRAPAAPAPPARPGRDTARRDTARRVSARQPAQHAPELAVLGLDGLRTYRQELITEEARVSYWRRILHARLDLAADDTDSLERMRAVLSEHQSDSRRLALTPVDVPGGLPPLPDLAVLWESQVGEVPADLLVRLAAAEHELSAYRRALHERLDAATGELIMRYRERPALALRALPLQRGDRSTSGS